MTIKTAAKPAETNPAPKASAPKATTPAKAPAKKAATPKAAAVAAPPANGTPEAKVKAPFTGISLGEFKRMAKALVSPKEIKAGNKQLQNKQARTRLSYALLQCVIWMGSLRNDLRSVIIGNAITDSDRKNVEVNIGFLLQNLIHACQQAKVKIPGLGRKFKATGTILDNLLTLDAAVAKLGSFVAHASEGTSIFPLVGENGEVVPSAAYDTLRTSLAQALESTYVVTRMVTNKSAQDVVTAHGQHLIKSKGAKFFEPQPKAPLTPEQEAKRAANAAKLKEAQAKAKAAKAAAVPPPAPTTTSAGTITA